MANIDFDGYAKLQFNYKTQQEIEMNDALQPLGIEVPYTLKGNPSTKWEFQRDFVCSDTSITFEAVIEKLEELTSSTRIVSVE